MNLTIRAKILIIATAVMLVAISAVIATSASLSTREFQSSLQSRSLAIGKSLAIQLERLLQLGLQVKDIVGFEEQCQEIVATYPGIDIALVANQNGEILFHSSSAAAQLKGRLRQAVINGAEGVIKQQMAGSTWYNAVIPAYNPQDEYVASIVVAFPAQLVSEKLSRMLWFDLGVSLAVLVTGLLILYLSLARYATKPLSGLINTVVKLRESPLDLTRRAAVNTSDELGQLGNAFNDLMEELQHTTVSKTEMEQAMEELQRLSAALFEQKEQVEVTLRSIGDAVISVDDKARVQFLNPIAENLCGWSLKEAMGLPLQNVLHLFNSISKEPLPNPFEPAFFKGEAVSNRVDAELLSRDGTAIGVDYTASPMHGPKGEINGGVLTLRDVSRERSMAQRLSWEASHDSLTGLFNRREFTERLEAVLAQMQFRSAHHVVFFLDLDRFKTVNDAAGHVVGDELLKQLAMALSERVRPTDTLARLGGDEFALLLEDCPLEQAERIAANLLEEVEEFRYQHEGKIYTVGVSIGLAEVDGHANCTQVMTMADTACYMAKEQGRNRVCVYQTRNTEPTERRRQTDWVARINSALAEDRFTLYHQAYLPLQSQSQDRQYLEVLLRLAEADGTLVQPSTFLPSAERYNLIPNIDRWVIKKVFSQYHKLVQQRSGKPLTCSINLAQSSALSRDLLEFIRSQAQVHAIPKGAICFEVPETMVMNNLAASSDFMQACRSLGFLNALDDFGSGLNGFSYVRTLPIDFIKIESNFIHHLETDQINKTIIETINRICHLKGIATIAGNTESNSTLETLRELGVDFAQGFAVHVPAPLIT